MQYIQMPVGMRDPSPAPGRLIDMATPPRPTTTPTRR